MASREKDSVPFGRSHEYTRFCLVLTQMGWPDGVARVYYLQDFSRAEQDPATCLPCKLQGTGNNHVEGDNEVCKLSKGMTCQPWRRTAPELAGTVGIVFNKPLNLQGTSQTSTQENPVPKVSQGLPVSDHLRNWSQMPLLAHPGLRVLGIPPGTRASTSFPGDFHVPGRLGSPAEPSSLSAPAQAGSYRSRLLSSSDSVCLSLHLSSVHPGLSCLQTAFLLHTPALSSHLGLLASQATNIPPV